eukprot:2558595-Prymnesium_polylepis.1
MHLDDTDDACTSVTISIAPDSNALVVSGHVPADGCDGSRAVVELVEASPMSASLGALRYGSHAEASLGGPR